MRRNGPPPTNWTPVINGLSARLTTKWARNQMNPRMDRAVQALMVLHAEELKAKSHEELIG